MMFTFLQKLPKVSSVDNFEHIKDDFTLNYFNSITNNTSNLLDTQFFTPSPDEPNETSSNQTKAIQFKCPDCDYCAARERHLIEHVKAVHLREKPFKCTKCIQVRIYTFYMTNN